MAGIVVCTSTCNKSPQLGAVGGVGGGVGIGAAVVTKLFPTFTLSILEKAWLVKLQLVWSTSLKLLPVT